MIKTKLSKNVKQLLYPRIFFKNRENLHKQKGSVSLCELLVKFGGDRKMQHVVINQ